MLGHVIRPSWSLACFPRPDLVLGERTDGFDLFPDNFQRHQGLCGGLSREQYGEVLTGCTEDQPLCAGSLNSGCDPFQDLFTDRFPVGIGVLGQLVDADNGDGKSFPELSDRFVIGQTTGNAGE